MHSCRHEPPPTPLMDLVSKAVERFVEMEAPQCALMPTWTSKKTAAYAHFMYSILIPKPTLNTAATTFPTSPIARGPGAMTPYDQHLPAQRNAALDLVAIPLHMARRLRRCTTMSRLQVA
ncbi:hypothetical protein SNOG_06778 [Parastagonospora nodorum SN15]|uniref:Uncharacterized protein n=1 Tax=Phaeosphaeria nodorum (strain SN15 / ATCC MYA-4574 / FGSC 10173) TaxID=321614 RepID=Q0UN86_PHANO|nr:hypothetical protein SNOG_06778 [Parastagonospora nodorum SN15]EAT85429.1 hypothetical protein SNOG_06778 [Parastagonospora nodorum SN15]